MTKVDSYGIEDWDTSTIRALKNIYLSTTSKF